MDTEQLRYFVSMARYRNFTETARGFYITQPVVTHQISALEREVGARLFLRTTGNVSFTRAGELFLEDAKCILNQEEQVPGHLCQLEPSGCWGLRIGYPNPPSRHFLPRLIATYREAYLQARVEPIWRDVTGIQADIDVAAYDVSFSILFDLKGTDGYACRKLGADFYCLACPQEYPCLDNAVIDYAKLVMEPFAYLSYTGGAYMYKQFLQIYRGLGFTPTSVVEYPALEGMIFTAECGQTIAILPFRIREYMYTIGLTFVLLEGHGQTIELGVTWRGPSDNPVVEWFMAMINRWLLEHPELF